MLNASVTIRCMLCKMNNKSAVHHISQPISNISAVVVTNAETR